VIMIPQRVLGAESRAENKSSNGPRRVRQIRNVKLALVAGDMLVSYKSASIDVNQGGTADYCNDSSLTENSFLSGIFYLHKT